MYSEIRIDSDLLVDALERSGMTARMYNFNYDGAKVLVIVQVQGGDADVFEAEIEKDPIVDTWKRIHTTGDVHEYRVEYSREMNVDGYAKIFSHSGILNQAVYQDDWRLHMFFPKQEDLASYERELEKIGFEVTPERILQSNPYSSDNLTQKQKEILELASRRGYFAVPRDVTLSELADELDISTESASERLRRALDNVLSSILFGRESDVE